MAGMIKNIFGLDTEGVLKERAEKNRLLAAQRIKQGNIDPTVAILGQQFGDMLGRGLMKRLGYEDPEMAKAELAQQFDKELRDKLDSGELNPTSKEFNLLMADYYGKLKDSQNQLRQLELYRIKENQETAINDKVLGRYVQLKDPVLGLSEKQIIDRLKIAFPNFDYSKLTVLNEGSDTPFGQDNNTNNKIKNYNPNKKYNIGDKVKINGIESTKVEGGWEQKSKEKEDTEKEKLLKTLDSRIENSMEKLKKLFN